MPERLRARRRRGRGGRRAGQRRRRHRHRLHRALARADAPRRRGRRRRVPDRTPYYNKPPQEGIVAHFEAIAAVTERPLIAYNIPSRVVVNIEPETISRLAEIERRGRGQAGAPDLEQARHIVASGLDLYAGDDVLLQPFPRARGRSAGSASTPTLSARRSPSRCAPRAQASSSGPARSTPSSPPAYELLTIATNPIPVKAALAILGHEVGGHRLPLVGPSEEELGSDPLLPDPARAAVAA